MKGGPSVIEAGFPSPLPGFLDGLGDQDQYRNDLARQKRPDGLPLPDLQRRSGALSAVAQDLLTRSAQMTQ